MLSSRSSLNDPEIHIDSPPYELELNPEQVIHLHLESKIRELPITFDTNNTPIIFFFQVFPLTDDELDSVFLPNQCEVIRKNLHGEPFQRTDTKTLSRIRDKKKQIKRKHDIVQRLFI